jgi:hypothetical protein
MTGMCTRFMALRANLSASSTDGITTELHPAGALATADGLDATGQREPQKTYGPFAVGFEAADQQIGLLPGGVPHDRASALA